MTVATDQVSLAIGRNGQNVRLASKLTGFEIQVLKEGGEEEYDMDLSEFREELGDVLFHKFFDENYETVRDVIEASKEELVATLGIEPEKIDEIVTMLKKGLEEAEIEEEGEEKLHEEPKVMAEAEQSTEKPEAEEPASEEKKETEEQP